MMTFRFICFRVFSHFYQLDKHVRDGQLEHDVIEMHEGVIVTMLTSPGIVEWWNQVGSNTFPADFCETVEGYGKKAEGFSAGETVWK